MSMTPLRDWNIRRRFGGHLLFIVLLFAVNLGGLWWVVQQTGAPHAQLPLFVLGTFGVDLLVVIVLFVLLDRHVFSPITQLTAETGAIARGELNQSITVVDGAHELGALSQSVHAMKDQLTSTRQAAQQFEQAVEHAGHAIYITDTDGTIEYVNPAFEEITKYSEEQAVGETPQLLTADRPTEADYEDIWETIRAGEVWEKEESMHQRATGELFITDQTITPITTADETVVKCVATMTDRTEQAVSSQQTQVLSRVVRHNLRTELNLIDGYAQQLKKADDADTQADYVRDIRDRVETLVEVSQKTQHGMQAFERDTYRASQRVCATCDRVATAFTNQYPQAEITTALPEYEVAVRGNVSTVLDELVENALEHNDQATPDVTISVARDDESEPPPIVRIEVADNGPGIPQGEREVLAEGEETQLVHGSGIGLWLVYWTITLAGGEVTIADRSPRGTCVVVTLPQASVQAFPRDTTTDNTSTGASTAETQSDSNPNT